MSNEVTVTLRADQRAQLMASVRKSSEIWNALYSGTRVSTYVFEEVIYAVLCDPAGARSLLYAAMKNCPNAVEVIKHAIKEGPRAPH
jgi:hypothetical protein